MSLNDAQRLELHSFLSVAAARGGPKPLILVSCSKAKGDHAAPAAELYQSNTFRKSLDLARRAHSPHYILSARYGVVSPHCVLPPYNVALKDLSPESREAWGESAAEVVGKILEPDVDVWFFASRHYSDPIAARIGCDGRRIHTPLAGLPIGKMNEWLTVAQRALDRKHAIAKLYKIFELLALKQKVVSLKDAIARQQLPDQGLYFFFDPSETTAFSNILPRLVRVGTHAVSLGSRATLRTRLRTHLGPRSGGGNHRGSVFRLHIGAAIIARDRLHTTYPHWGKGQNATKDIRESELALEIQVSKYIGSLQVLFIEIADVAGPASKRAYFERQAVALMSQDEVVLDPPSSQWLGHWSPKPEIRASGLWNIHHIATHADLSFVDQLHSISDREALLI